MAAKYGWLASVSSCYHYPASGAWMVCLEDMLIDWLTAVAL
ncbi:MAG: hypothetical protein OT477_07970 [Chloroflexi bacterium]|nr:hypothetical protein [Chloroflexota bacterium]